MMRVADVVWQRLKQEVDTVFYLPGGLCGPLVDALDQSGLNAVSCLHEQGAGFAAVGYAQCHGFGVALATGGPGATNMMTPCLAAWMDSVPVLFISGTVPSDQIALPDMRSRGTQEGKTIKMVLPITKMAETLFNPPDADDSVATFIRTAKMGRPGPVWLEIPQDIQAMQL